MLLPLGALTYLEALHIVGLGQPHDHQQHQHHQHHTASTAAAALSASSSAAAHHHGFLPPRPRGGGHGRHGGGHVGGNGGGGPTSSTPALSFSDSASDNLGERPVRDAAGGGHLPIDVVYTWVNGSDPRFVAALDTYQNTYRGQGKTGTMRTKGTKGTTEGGAIGRTRLSTRAHERRRGGERGGHGGGGVNATAGPTLRRNRYRDNDELRYSLRSLFR